MKQPRFGPGLLSEPAGYGFAILSTAVVLWLLRVGGIEPLSQTYSLLLTLLILFTAYVGGTRAGLVSTAIASAAMYWSSSMALPVSAPPATPPLLLAIVGSLVSSVIGSLHRLRDNRFSEAEARRAEDPAFESEREFSQAILESIPGVLYFYTQQGPGASASVRRWHARW